MLELEHFDSRIVFVNIDLTRLRNSAFSVHVPTSFVHVNGLRSYHLSVRVTS